MHCVLLSNPAAGRLRHRRAEQIRQVAEALSALGHRVEVIHTKAPGSATGQAREAVRAGAEVVFACGGDGTMHEVLQGLVTEGVEPVASLGLIPLGSANALARQLHLSLDPVQAALQQIHGFPMIVPVGKLTLGGQCRYFTVMAGAGPDGALVYNLCSARKSRLGRLVYYLQAAGVYATRRFPPFEVEFTDVVSGEIIHRSAAGLMAIRVESLGGLFRGLAGSGAPLQQPQLRLAILRPPAKLSLPLWFVSGWLGLLRFNPLIEFVEASVCVCRPLAGSAPHLEADGESLGRIPSVFSVVPRALRLLLPNR